MKMRLKILTIGFTFTLTIFAQKEDVIWYFGGDFSNTTTLGAGLDFNSGSPVPILNSAMGYTEGSAIQCDKFGNLLFYTNGETVWDRTHTIMQNGTNLGGGVSSMQSSLIIPFPNDSSKYYIFANAGLPTAAGLGLFYSEIDMTLNSGLGDVTSVKKVPMLTQNSEWLAGNWHANEMDYWVVASDYDSCIFYSYHISSGGISEPIKTTLFEDKTALLQIIEFNNKGDKVTFMVNNGLLAPGYRMIADFDKNNGIISNPILIDSMINQAACFSPDDNLFYYFMFEPNVEVLYQCDMNATSIPASKQQIISLPDSYHTSMKLGPDNKIYCNDHDLTTLDVIQMPNQQGVSCNFLKNEISLNGRVSGRLLPNKTFGQKYYQNHVSVIELSNVISISPNPFSNLLTITTSNQIVSYKLYDCLGTLIKGDTFFPNCTVYNIETNLEKGIYFLRLYNKDGNYSTETVTRL